MTLSFLQTLAFFKADVKRRLFLEGKEQSYWNALMILLNRGVVSVFIYRLNRYLYFKKNIIAKILIRLLRYVEFHYCRNEIEPTAEIAEGLVLSDFGGVGLSHANMIGKNCTFLGKGTPTLGAMEDVEVGVDKIRIGDHCVFGPNVRIVNNVTIANGVQIKANSVVMNSISVEGALVSGFPAKQISVVPMDNLLRWSPVISKYVG